MKWGHAESQCSLKNRGVNALENNERVNKDVYGGFDDLIAGSVVEDIILVIEPFQVVDNSNCVESAMSIQPLIPVVKRLIYARTKFGPFYPPSCFVSAHETRDFEKLKETCCKYLLCRTS